MIPETDNKEDIASSKHLTSGVYLVLNYIS